VQFFVCLDAFPFLWLYMLRFSVSDKYIKLVGARGVTGGAHLTAAL
jgi:hypothetical protein